MYGVYCGPYWSNGKFQKSVVGTLESLDDLDECCKQHDAGIARGSIGADDTFISCAGATGAVGKIFGLGVRLFGPESVLLGTNDRANTLGGEANLVATENMPRLRKVKTDQTKSKQQGSRPQTTVVAPVGVATIKSTPAPKIAHVKNGMVVSHRTFIGAVSGSTNYSVSGWNCNPGLLSSFPWASRLATRFEKYRFKRLKYEYVSVVNTSTSGVVTMSFDFDPVDPLPATKYIQAETVPCKESNVWVTFGMAVAVDSNWSFIRQGVVQNTDLKTYDKGIFMVGTEYCPSSATIGELYVDYELELMHPTEPIAVSASITGLGSNAAPFTTNVVKGGSLPCEINQAGDGLTFITNGEYLISYLVNGSSITVLSLPTGTATISSVIGSVNSGAYCVRIFKVRATRGSTVLFNNRLTGTFISCTLLVTEVDYDNIPFVV